MINIDEAIKERENQVTNLQTQISTLHGEIKALRVAARILEGGNLNAAEEVTASANSSGAEKTRVWP